MLDQRCEPGKRRLWQKAEHVGFWPARFDNPCMTPTDPTLEASFRNAGPQALAAALEAARARTLALFDLYMAAGLDDMARVPLLPIVNPPLWELGHLAWFAEWYLLRGARSSEPGAAQLPSMLAGSDAWFDSNQVHHDTRWSLPLPPTQEVQAYARAVLDGVQARLAREPDEDGALYFYRLCLAHEDMHGEAFAYTLQTLGVDWPDRPRPPARQPGGELHFAGCSVILGSRPDAGFVFDNEKWAHARKLAPFSIDAGLVTNAQYLRFVEAGGMPPQGWERGAQGWQAPRFGRMEALDPDEPVRHVSLPQAQAYCAWTGRRLPLEAEWVMAAQSGDPDFRWGELWEWTASPFLPFEGFMADPYREYSAPYFGSHQTLKGASFATPARLRSPVFRNFYAPQRSDIFVGFRTCA